MTDIDQTISRLAGFEPSPFPVLSLYLRAERDGAGHDRFLETARKQLNRKVKTYPAGSDERQSFESDQERILALLESEDEAVRPQCASLAIFACQGEDLFEVLELDAELKTSKLVAAAKPDLFQLAWLSDHFARYAVVLADSQGARLFVFGLGGLVDEEEVDGKSVRRQSNGGWSQSRFQRRRENAVRENIRAAIEALEEIVKVENVTSIILAGDAEAVAQIRAELPQHLEELVEEEAVRMAQDASQREILEQTLEVFRAADLSDDQVRAQALVNEFRADGLACVGMSDTLDAVIEGRADEVLMRAPAPEIETEAVSEIGRATLTASYSEDDADTRDLGGKLADLLITHAQQTGATLRFLEGETALSELGGVGAFLRYRTG